MKEELTGDWKAKVRTKIKQVDVVAVICGADHIAARYTTYIFYFFKFFLTLFMEIEQRGTPPYTIFSAETTEIRSHPAYRDSFGDAIDVIFDLTDGGSFTQSKTIVTPPRIVDSKGEVVFSAENEGDLDLLHQIDQG